MGFSLPQAFSKRLLDWLMAKLACFSLVPEVTTEVCIKTMLIFKEGKMKDWCNKNVANPIRFVFEKCSYFCKFKYI